MNSLHEELLKVEFKILRESKGISQLEIAHKLRINLSVIQTIDDKDLIIWELNIRDPANIAKGSSILWHMEKGETSRKDQ